jgi:hypothetical protein
MLLLGHEIYSVISVFSLNCNQSQTQKRTEMTQEWNELLENRDILHYILQYLHVEHLPIITLVSQDWNNVVTQQTFWNDLCLRDYPEDNSVKTYCKQSTSGTINKYNRRKYKKKQGEIVEKVIDWKSWYITAMERKIAHEELELEIEQEQLRAQHRADGELMLQELEEIIYDILMKVHKGSRCRHVQEYFHVKNYSRKGEAEDPIFDPANTDLHCLFRCAKCGVNALVTSVLRKYHSGKHRNILFHGHRLFVHL